MPGKHCSDDSALEPTQAGRRTGLCNEPEPYLNWSQHVPRYQLRLNCLNFLWTIYDYGCKSNTIQTFDELEARDKFESVGGNWHQRPVLH